MINVMELVASLALDSSEYENGLNKSSEQAESIGSKLKSGLGTIGQVGAAALTATTTAAVAFGKTAIDAGSQFDSAMAQVAATMGVTTDEIKDLRDFAQEMGASTAFSATEAAEALNYMALAGYDTETSMQMLPTVLDLAAAGGMSLATASDMVTDTQSALGLSLEETAKMVDQMAKASSKTNTSVSQLGDAMLTIGATARGVKGGTVELSSVLGVLADNGIKASEGGTHLRNIILSLQTPTENGTEALEALGMSYADMYDEAGNMRALPEIFQQLQTAMEGMTQQSKDAIVSGIFNKTDLSSVNALIGTSAERWEELGEEISNATGAAQAMANTQLDNLAGDVTLFQSALEGAKIAVSDQLTPSIREFVQVGTDALSEMTKGFKEDGLQGAMEAFGGFLSDGIALIADKLPEAVDAGASVLGAVIDGISDNIPLLADSAVEIATSFTDLIIDNAPKLLDAAADLIGQLAVGIGDALPDLIPSAVNAIASFGTSLADNAGGLADGALAIVTGLGEGIINSIPVLLESVPELLGSIASAMLENVQTIQDAGAELFATITDRLPEVIGAVTGFFDEHGAEMAQAGLDFLSHLFDTVTDISAVLWEKLPIIEAEIYNFFTDRIEEIADVGLQFLSSLTDKIPEAVANIVARLPQLLEDLAGWFGDEENSLGTAGVKFFTSLVSNMIEITKAILKALGVLITSIIKELKNNWPEIKKAGVQFFSALVGRLAEATKTILSDVGGLIKEILLAFVDALPDMLQTGVDIVAEIGKGIVNATADAIANVDSLVADIMGVFDSLIDFIGGEFYDAWMGAWERVKTVFRDAFDAFVDYAKTPINTVIRFINNAIGGIESALNAVIGGLNSISIEIPGWVPGIGGNRFGVDIAPASFGRIAELAEGGRLKEGKTAIVGEYAPELLRVVNGEAVVTPLNTGRFSSGNQVTINVYPQKGQSEEEIARQVERQFTLWDMQTRAYAGG